MEYQPGVGEWFATAVVVLLIVGPIAWALTAGRRRRPPDAEDARGDTAYTELIRRQNTHWRE